MKPSEFRKKWAKPVVVDADVAAKLGLTEAIIVSNIHYWCLEHEENDRKKNFQDGFFWNYIAFEEWQSKSLPFLSLSTIKRTVKKLVESGIIITGNYNKLVLDKTTWYRIDYVKLGEALTAEETNELSDSVNLTPSIVSNWNDHSVNLTPTIPDTTTDTNLDIVPAPRSADDDILILDSMIAKSVKLDLKEKKIIEIAEALGIEFDKPYRAQSMAKMLKKAENREARYQMLKNWVITRKGMLARYDEETNSVTVKKTHQETAVENILAKRDINNFTGLNLASIPDDMREVVSLERFKAFVKFAQQRFPQWQPIEADFKSFQYRMLELGEDVVKRAIRNVYGILEHTDDCKYWAELSPSHFLGSSKMIRNAYEDRKLNARKYATLEEEKRYALIQSINQ